MAQALQELEGPAVASSRVSWAGSRHLAHVERYAEIEGRLPSTFFFIPFKGEAGKASGGGNGAPFHRRAPYDIQDYRDVIGEVLAGGREVGLHGIDTWCDPERAASELAVIRELAGTQDVGVRTHWLYFSEATPGVLAGSGFLTIQRQATTKPLGIERARRNLSAFWMRTS